MKTLILFLSLSCICLVDQVSAQQRLPDIVLPDTSGSIYKLSSLKAKLILIDFWASWCGPCRLSNRSMNKVYERYKKQGFEILGVSVDVNEAGWKRAIKQDKMEWKQVIDTKATAGSPLLRVWRIESIPTSYLIDDKGAIVALNPSRKDLLKLLPELLPAN